MIDRDQNEKTIPGRTKPSKLSSFTDRILDSSWFETFIIGVIVINCILIGVETAITSDLVHTIQKSITYIFVVEILIRWMSRKSVKTFFMDGWNLFDLTIVIVSLIPESLFEDASMITAIRILRVFRILRLLRTATEIKLIISVLVRSLSALTYNTLFFFIFLYLFAIIGVTIFRLPDAESANPEISAKLQQYYALAPNAPSVSPDPYGTLGESMFTLFRILTGEDWTDLRYNLMAADEMGLIHSSPVKITMFHVIWYILSAFLLLNLVLGAILNNYNVIMEENREKKKQEEKRAKKLAKKDPGIRT